MTGVPAADRLADVEAALLARWPESRIAPSLDRIRRLVDLLGQPQAAYPVVHLTGTNGKTSTARMVDALLRGFGLRTGRYTSPHLQTVRERIALDGSPVSPERFVATYDDVAHLVGLAEAGGDLPLSFFEVVTGMAFAAFADAPVDVAVVEVGMGGRWDATNVADGRVAVVTTVALDHAAYLGDTVAQVAAEKAGIVKPGTDLLVLAEQPPEAAAVPTGRAAEVGTPVVQAGVDFGVAARRTAVGGQLLTLRGLGGDYPEVFLPLYGAHQAANAACALAAVEGFFGAAGRSLDPEAVRRAFAGVRSPGRLEVVRHQPLVLLDAAHNPAGAQALAEALAEAFTLTPLVGVVAALADKDVAGLLAPLEPVLAEVVVTESSSPRRVAASALAEVATDAFGPDRVSVAPRLADALDLALRRAEEQAGTGAGVLVTGSVVTVGEARTLLGGEPST